jgi:hypothetical protein
MEIIASPVPTYISSLGNAEVIHLVRKYLPDEEMGLVF